MQKRFSLVVAAGALLVPLPAIADCAERIAAVENHPAILEAPQEPAQPGAAVAARGNEEEAVMDEMVEGGEAVQEDGGVTVHAEGGPAEPRENWFTDDDAKGTVLTHLDAARDARSGGDEAACIEQIQQAEDLLKDPAG